MIWKARLRGLELVIVKDTRREDTLGALIVLMVMDYELGCFLMREIMVLVFGMVLLLGTGSLHERGVWFLF
jgi:hypothetical protein